MKFILLLILMVFVFTSCVNKDINIEKKNENINYRGTIKTKSGEVLAYDKTYYKLVIKSNISKKDFYELKDNLKHILNLDEKKFIKYSRLSKVRNLVYSYTLTKDDIKEIKKIALKYENLFENKTLYIQISGTKRVYPKVDILSPFMGYIKRTNENGIDKFKGVKGLENYYDKVLSKNKDVILNIDLQRQINLEKELTLLKKKLNSFEITSVVLELDSGYIDAIASSNRYNPMSIKAKEIPFLDPTVITYPFPVDFLYEPIKKAISENISDKNSYMYFIDKLNNIGLRYESKIDLNYEHLPITFSSNYLKGNFKVNLMQIVRAYSIFYNDGVLKDFKIAKQETINQQQVLSKKLSNKIKDSLEEFYKSIENKKMKVRNRTASVKFKYFRKFDKRYLKVYLIIDNEKLNETQEISNNESKNLEYQELYCLVEDNKRVIASVSYPKSWEKRKKELYILLYTIRHGLNKCWDR